MASPFKNKFFSKKGQVERIKNVGSVLKAAVLKNPFKGGGVQANTGNKTVDKVLSAAASNPLAVAAVTGTIANIPKAVSVIKARNSARAAAGAAKAAARAAKNKGPTGSENKPGLLDLNELGKQAATSAPGILKPSADTGGVITKNTATTSSSSSGSRRTTRRRTKSRKSSKSRRSTRKASRKRSSRRKKRYGTAKQYARKGGKSVKYAKNGTPYIILANGRARFIKGKHR